MSHQNDFLNSPKCDITHIADEIPGIVFQILQAPDGMISFPFFSVAAQQLLGLGKKEMEEAKNGLVNFIVKEDFTRWLSVLKKHARSLSSFSEEIRVIGKDGSIIQLSGISKPLPIADKNILWNTVLFDITDRKATEKALEDAQNQIHTVISSLPCSLYKGTIYKDGRIVFEYASEGIKELMGVSAKDIMKDSDLFYNCFVPEDKEVILANHKVLLRSKKPRLWDKEVQLTNGKWVQLNARPEKTAEGNVS
ncbi:MAG: PAS domain-containing protein [Alphaproteobacteria bacterium]|nr:PAS domain-containing protein [Alphaproteobacteria bacterium]